MRFYTFCIILLLFILSFSIFAQPKLSITYPKPGAEVFSTDSTFIFGKVEPAQAELWIDSLRVPVFPNGAFLAMMPLDSSFVNFDFKVIFKNDTLNQRLPVRIPTALISCPADTLVFDTTLVYPQNDLTLRSGDLLQVAVKGTPGCRARFAIPGVIDPVTMYEIPASRRYFWRNSPVDGRRPTKNRGVAGVYTGTYIIKPQDRCEKAKVKIELIKNGRDTLSILVPAHLSIDTLETPIPAQIPNSLVNTPKVSRIGATYLLPERSKIGVTGQVGGKYRIALTENENIWMRLDTLNFLPPNTNLKRGTIFFVHANQQENISTVTVRLREPVPVKIQQLNRPARFLITFYGIKVNNPQIYSLRNLSEIKSIKWQEATDEYHQLLIEMENQQIWGYRPYFEKNQFILEIKNQPDFAQPPFSSLKDIVITLDPGHNPDSGAVGPTGLLEKDVNLAVSHRLKRMLERKGALVVLTRDQEQGVSLLTRPKLAEFVGADVLISMHFNSLPDGVNPYRNHGTSTYYYRPMSYPLALAIHESLLEHLKLPDFGLFYRSFVLTRPTEMLSVLLEPAFIINPEEEMKIQTTAFQDSIALAVTTALEKFFDAHREAEKK